MWSDLQSDHGKGLIWEIGTLLGRLGLLARLSLTTCTVLIGCPLSGFRCTWRSPGYRRFISIGALTTVDFELDTAMRTARVLRRLCSPIAVCSEMRSRADTEGARAGENAAVVATRLRITKKFSIIALNDALGDMWSGKHSVLKQPCSSKTSSTARAEAVCELGTPEEHVFSVSGTNYVQAPILRRQRLCSKRISQTC